MVSMTESASFARAEARSAHKDTQISANYNVKYICLQQIISILNFFKNNDGEMYIFLHSNFKMVDFCPHQRWLKYS